VESIAAGEPDLAIYRYGFADVIPIRDLVNGKDAALNRNEDYSYKLDGVGRPVSMVSTGTINGKPVPPMTYNIKYSCN